LWNGAGGKAVEGMLLRRLNKFNVRLLERLMVGLLGGLLKGLLE
jgi:hypothetical protein